MAGEQLTKQDVVKIITTIKVNYSEAYVGYSEEEMKTLIGCWHESLKVYPRAIVMQAVKKAIENSEFAPKLATILNEIKVIISANEPTDEELWAKLTAVLGEVYQVSRYLAYPQHHAWAGKKLDEIYDKLDERLKLFVVNRSTLVELSEMSEDSLHFERVRFFKQMPLLRVHAEDKANAALFLSQVGITTTLPQTTLQIEDNKKRK